QLLAVPPNAELDARPFGRQAKKTESKQVRVPRVSLDPLAQQGSFFFRAEGRCPAIEVTLKRDSRELQVPGKFPSGPAILEAAVVETVESLLALENHGVF